MSDTEQPSSGHQSPGGPVSRQAVGDLVIGAALLIFGLWVLWTSGSIPTGAAYAAVDARFFPRVVGVGLCISGIGVLFGAWRAWRTNARGEVLATLDWPSLLAITGLLFVYILLYLPLGFIVASTLMMVAGARVFSSTRPLRDLFWGAAISLATYLLFTRLIRLELPTGWLWETFL